MVLESGPSLYELSIYAPIGLEREGVLMWMKVSYIMNVDTFLELAFGIELRSYTVN